MIINRLAQVQAELDTVTRGLLFVTDKIPALVPNVKDCVADKTVVVECANLDQVQIMLDAFPVNDGDHYVSGDAAYAPVSREESLTLRYPSAASPVSPYFELLSMGERKLCWQSGTVNVSVTVPRDLTLYLLLWVGYERFAKSSSLTWYMRKLEMPKTLPPLDGVAMPELLYDVVTYLNEFIERMVDVNRGYPPPKVLTWLARQHFSLPVTISVANVQSYTGKQYAVSVQDANGRTWHELCKVAARTVNPKEGQEHWYDLVKTFTERVDI